MRWLRRLYDWVLSWAESRYGSAALAAFSFAESSFFPVPPDVLLIALCMGRPQRAFRFALICSAASVLGGALGYGIGLWFYDWLGAPLLEFYGMHEKYAAVAALYDRYSGWAVGIAGFTPIPYKVFTIAAGVFRIHFGVFLLASALSRSARFFLVAALIRRFGPSVRPLIDRYFNALAILFVVLLVLGFVAVKQLL